MKVFVAHKAENSFSDFNVDRFVLVMSVKKLHDTRREQTFRSRSHMTFTTKHLFIKKNLAIANKSSTSVLQIELKKLRGSLKQKFKISYLDEGVM